MPISSTGNERFNALNIFVGHNQQNPQGYVERAEFFQQRGNTKRDEGKYSDAKADYCLCQNDLATAWGLTKYKNASIKCQLNLITGKVEELKMLDSSSEAPSISGAQCR